MSDYEEKKQARAARYRARAASARSEASSRWAAADKLSERFYMGQPIIVGHHSEDGARNAQKRMWSNTEKSIEADKKAAYYEAKAEAAENNTAISSDDPEAVSKLEDKLAGLEQYQSDMRRINAYYRKHKTCKGCEGVSDEEADKLDASMKTAHSRGTAPFPLYELTNNNSNIDRIRKRIAQLKRRDESTYSGWEFDGGRVVANKEENRLQIFFDDIPEKEIRLELSRRGFHFSKANGNAWQRKLNGSAFFSAKAVLEKYYPEGRAEHEQPRVFEERKTNAG